MKLYVLPVEVSCNAKCNFCITKYRKNAEREFLEFKDLISVLDNLELKKIEITGGGEPTLNPNIEKIIDLCTRKAPTIMYTHGASLGRVSNLYKLENLCVSLAHYDEKENKRIMGVYPNLEILKRLKIPIKFSLLLHKSGIYNKDEVLNYLNWANDLVNKVVIRQLFEHDYRDKLQYEFISSKRIFTELGITKFELTKHGNPIFNFRDLEVEIEYRSCSCEKENPVLHADGKLHRGWSDEYYDINGG